MNAAALLQLVTDSLFIAIFFLVLASLIRRPTGAHLDVTFFFADIAAVVLLSWLITLLHIKSNAIVNIALVVLVMALPYLLLRLLNDFRGVSQRLMACAGAGFGLSVIVILIWARGQLPRAPTLALVAYFVVVTAYVAGSVIRASHSTLGVTKRRMQAVAIGTGFLALVIAMAGVIPAIPHGQRGFAIGLSDVFSLGCGIAYFVGFAAPGWLRRSWQEPEIRKFVSRTVALPHLPDAVSVVQELEQSAERVFGTNLALIGLWNETLGTLEFPNHSLATAEAPIDKTPEAAFSQNRTIFVPDARTHDPESVAFYSAHEVNSVLAVPVTVGTRHLGVLALYATRAPVFAEDDLTLAQLLADQIGVVVEIRELIGQAARVLALQESTRLKDDFLSAAAHDLKTPLTILIGQAQLMQAQARKNPQLAADPAGIERIVREAGRMRGLVTELLDVGRMEEGRLVELEEGLSLADLVRDVVKVHQSELHPYQLAIDSSILVSADPIRMRQLISNLLENAIKYSPQGGTITVTVQRNGDRVELSVRDQGVGVPQGDIPRLFDRFHRGANVDDRRFAGMGLGLFICRGIVEQHGGRIWATSDGVNQGAVIHVELPIFAAAGTVSSSEAPSSASVR